MSKISNTTNYPQQSPVASADFLIGTDAVTSKTKTFTVQSLADFIDGQVTLAEVLAAGNTDGGLGMSVTGASSFGNLTLTGTLTAGGGVGTAGQFLSSTGTGIQWVSETFVDGSGTQHFIPVWQDADTLADSVIFQNSAASRVSIDGADLQLNQGLSAAGNLGSSGQLLSSTGTAIQWVNPYAPSGTQYTLAMFDTTSSIGNAIVSQNAAGTEMTFGSASTGASLDMQQNKLVFAGDATNTFIKADSVTPENLEIHADQNIQLRPDGYVVIYTGAAAPTTASDLGDQGSIVYDDNYLYICVQDDVWKRAALSTW